MTVIHLPGVKSVNLPGVTQPKKRIRRVSLTITVTFSVPGFHCYPDAPDEVSYLRNVHRHLFNYTVEVPVTHDNRDIEYHMFKNYCLSLFAEHLDADSKSCETLGLELANRVLDEYDFPWIKVDVWEDTECGSTVVIENSEEM